MTISERGKAIETQAREQEQERERVMAEDNSECKMMIEQIKEILNTKEYISRIAYPTRVECKLAEYNIIQYSKFGWLKDAIDENPFNKIYNYRIK